MDLWYLGSVALIDVCVGFSGSVLLALSVYCVEDLCFVPGLFLPLGGHFPRLLSSVILFNSLVRYGRYFSFVAYSLYGLPGQKD